jgi:hypothetical protein
MGMQVADYPDDPTYRSYSKAKWRRWDLVVASTDVVNFPYATSRNYENRRVILILQGHEWYSRPFPHVHASKSGFQRVADTGH